MSLRHYAKQWLHCGSTTAACDSVWSLAGSDHYLGKRSHPEIFPLLLDGGGAVDRADHHGLDRQLDTGICSIRSGVSRPLMMSPAARRFPRNRSRRHARSGPHAARTTFFPTR